MLRVLSAVEAASSGTEEVAILLETHSTAGLTDHQVCHVLYIAAPSKNKWPPRLGYNRLH